MSVNNKLFLKVRKNSKQKNCAAFCDFFKLKLTVTIRLKNFYAVNIFQLFKNNKYSQNEC